MLAAVVAHRLRELGGEDDMLAAIAEHLAQYGLRTAAPGIDVSGVEQRHAEIDRLVDHLARGFEVGALAEIVAAEADGGNPQAGAAEIANLHDRSCGEPRGGRIVARTLQARKVWSYRLPGRFR